MSQIIESEIINTDRYLELVNENLGLLCYIKTDYLKNGGISFEWRGEQHPKDIREFAIIGHSDYSVDGDNVHGFKLVFCVNKNSDQDKIFSLPLGIPNDCDDLPELKILGDKKILIEISNLQLERDKLAYINFSVETFQVERSYILNNFKEKNWIKISEPDKTLDGRRNYLLDLRSSKFCFCPRGNGIDTHRMWESLYMGCIPIVKRHQTHDFCYDLPVLFVDDWGEINEEYLQTIWQEYSQKEWNLEKLKISYWKKFILDKVNGNN